VVISSASQEKTSGLQAGSVRPTPARVSQNMEIEVKLTYKNKAKIINWLLENGFHLVQQKEIQDTYFSLGHNSMSNQNGLYRIRHIVGQKTELTLKDNCQDSNGVWSRRELNVTINNPENMKNILSSLSCVLVKENFSKRDIWKNGEVSFEFISFSKPKVLELIEVEGPSQAAVQKIVDKLGDKVQVAGEEIFSIFDKK